jgi:transposase-like protein
MGKQRTKWRMYTQEFKTESVALVAQYEKPVSQIAADLAVNEIMPRRWVKKCAGSGGNQPAAIPRTRAGAGRETDPLAEGTQGAVERA